MAGLNYKQFKRTYAGNFSFNFVLGLSAFKDFGVKTYSNFYLTNRYKLDEVFDIVDDKVKVENMVTTISFGDSSNFLTFSRRNFNYGNALFTNTLSTTNLHLDIFDNNICNIYYVDNYIKFYLVCDVNNSLYFVRQRYLTFNTDINSQDFTYLFSEDTGQILLFKHMPTGSRFVTKNGISAVTIPVLSGQGNFPTFTSSPLTLNRNLYFDPSQTLNFSFITYNSDNTIDFDKSIFNLRNNYLLHKKYSQKDSYTDIMVLKNQLLVDDVFASANNLLSGGSQELYVDDLREYTSIFNDIKEETTNDLELNYVFYNQSYKIKPGSNTFISPSSMYPFTKLNINDSKFVPSGAFAHITPEFADRVYHVSKEPQNRAEGQYLLCTWLSGSGLTENKTWIDRYYYPDLMEKKAAIAAKPYQYPTYENYIEDLIQSNILLKTAVSEQKIFDKISDFVFEPDETYIYERISPSLFSNPLSSINTCSGIEQTFPVNYFKELNAAGKFTFAIYFEGNASTWEIFSDRNDINSGINIVKTPTTVEIQYTLFRANADTENLVPVTPTSAPISVKFKPLKENFLCISVDAASGEVYFCVNNEIVFRAPLGLNTPMDPYQYSNKRLLYGDFFINVQGVKHNILSYTGVVFQPLIEPEFTPPELAFALPLIAGKVPIDDLYITLPCGMRNGSDNIALLQHLCDSSSFKSNNINILVKNLNIDNQRVLNGVAQTINSSIKDFIPSNSKVNNITFSNYK